MLDGMRRAAQNWMGKTILTIVFSFLIVSFAIWGIGDMFRGIGVSHVAEVGSVNISTQEFRQNYQTQITNLQRQTRRPITNDQARAFGLDQQVLGRMISEAALDQKVRALNLALSDETIGRMILDDPVFKGGDGRFDRARFNDVLRDNGFTELSFVREQRKNYLRQDVVETVTGRVSVPIAMQEAIHRYASETRAVEYIVLPETVAGEIGAPKDDDLNTWFEIRKSSWRAPEYRKIVTLAVTPVTVADPSQVSDADARALYERVKGERFGTAETRDIQQLVFQTEDGAKTAYDQIVKGMSFLDLAKEQGRSEADVSLGSVARSAILDPAVAEAAFSTPAGQISPPIKGRFGYVLVKIGAIAEGRTKAFEEVASEMKQEIAVSRARTKVTQIHDAIEDERASGKTLAEAAQKLALQVTTIDAIDASGLDKNASPISLRDADSVLRAVFASDIGVDNEAVNTRDNGYVWFEVLAIEPAHDRKLSEVKDEVVKAWREDELRRALTSKAVDFVKALEAGETLEKIALDNGGLSVQSANDVRRGGTATLPPGVVAQIFNLPVGRAGSASGEGLTRILFKVNDSVVPVFDAESEQSIAIAAQLSQNLSNDLLVQYIAKVQSDLGVKINGAALNLAVGGGDAY